MVIDSETIRTQQAALLQRIAENDASVSDLEKLTEIDSADLKSRICRFIYSKISGGI